MSDGIQPRRPLRRGWRPDPWTCRLPRLSLRHRAPASLSHALHALWLDAKGDWDGAHDAAQADEGGAGDWVHAYLHRKEGDAGNAAYWYRRARKPVCRTSLEEEWVRHHNHASSRRMTGLSA